MRKPGLAHLANAELVRRFAEAARKRGLAVLDSDVRNVNRVIQYMRAIDSELRTRGIEARRELVPLLDSKDRFVQYYAAKNLLGISPVQARAIIEYHHEYWHDVIAEDAGMTLPNLDSGVFKPD